MKTVPRVRSRAVAMTLSPEIGESFPGYLWRLADWNVIDKTRDLILAADLKAGNGSDFSELSDMRLRRVAEMARLDFEAVQNLFRGTYSQGVPPQWLRHKQPSVGQALLNGSGHHRSAWMLSPITFCQETWSHLLRRCPSCAAPFDWKVVISKTCARCDRLLIAGDFLPVTTEQRLRLQKVANWLRAPSLPIDELDLQGSSTLAGLSKGELFQLAVILGRALAKQNFAADLRNGQGTAGLSQLESGVEAVTRLDAFLASMSPAQKNKTMPPFFRQLALSKRLATGELSVVLGNIVAPFEEPARGVQRLKADREKAGAMTARQLAKKLRVERSTLKVIVDRKKIKVFTERGVARRHVWFTDENFRQASEFLDSRVSARAWMRSHHVSTLEMVQLVDEGLLEILLPGEALDPSKVDLDRKVADAMIKTIMSDVIVSEPDHQWVRIEKLFTCLGVSHKPWASLLRAAMKGKLKGELLSRDEHFNLRGLYIHRDLACEFRNSLLNGKQPMFTSPIVSCADWYPIMTRSEAEVYLNVSSPEVTWLARQGHFGDEAKSGGFLPRGSVEVLGREFIGTREIAILAGCTTASVSWALKSSGINPVMIEVPFWRRGEVMGEAGAIHLFARSSEGWGEWAGGPR